MPTGSLRLNPMAVRAPSPPARRAAPTAALNAPSRAAYAAVFAVGFLFVIAFYLGLPIDFIRDYLDHLAMLSTFDYSDLVLLHFNPLSPGWFFIEDIYYLCPGTGLLTKPFHAVFGARATPYFVWEAFACGVLCCLLYALVRRATGRSLDGWLAVLLYLSFPTNFLAVTLHPATEYHFSVLRFLAFVFFSRLVLEPRADTARFVLTALGWYLAVLFAIKLKASEKLLPFVFLACLALRAPATLQGVGAKRYLTLVTVALLMLVSVPPLLGPRSPEPPFVTQLRLEAAQRKDPRPVGAGRKEFLMRTLDAPLAYQTLFHGTDEEFPFTTLLRKRSPQSLSGSLGAVPAWLFWISALLAPLLLMFLRNHAVLAHTWTLFGLWTLAVSAGLASPISARELRYLNFLFLPAIPFFFASSAVLTKCLGRIAGTALRVVLAASLVFTVATNLAFFVSEYVYRIGGHRHAEVEAAKWVFKDLRGRLPVSDELYEAANEWTGTVLLFDWQQMWQDRLNRKEEPLQIGGLNLSGFHGTSIYLLTHERHTKNLAVFLNQGARAELMRGFPYLSARPLAFRALRQVHRLTGKPATPDTLWLYRIRVPSPSDSSESLPAG